MTVERIDGLDAAQLKTLHDWYAREWWTRGRTLEDVRSLLEHSDLVFAYADTANDRLMAFARVLTDRTIKAIVLDMIVGPGVRGRGLGARVMDDIFAAPELAQVRHFELYCAPEMRDFYRRWGFSSALGDLVFMRAEPGAEHGDRQP